MASWTVLAVCSVLTARSTANCANFDKCYENHMSGFNTVNASNVDKFCASARHELAYCINNESGGSAFARGRVLKQCADTAGGERRKEIEMIARLYFFACVYNDILDATKEDCFEFLDKKCMKTEKPSVDCYYPPSCPPGRHAMKSNREAKKNNAAMVVSLPMPALTLIPHALRILR